MTTQQLKIPFRIYTNYCILCGARVNFLFTVKAETGLRLHCNTGTNWVSLPHHTGVENEKVALRFISQLEETIYLNVTNFD